MCLNPSACKCKLFKQEKDMYDVSLSFNIFVITCLLEIHDLSHINVQSNMLRNKTSGYYEN